MKADIEYPKNTYDGVEALFTEYSCQIEQTSLEAEIDPSALERIQANSEWVLEKSKGTVNFGGKFIIAEWGCGTECQTGVAIDLTNGSIAALPTSEWGKEYRKDSLLLIVNPPSQDDDNAGRPPYAYPAYYIWQEGKFILLHDTRNLEEENN